MIGDGPYRDGRWRRNGKARLSGTAGPAITRLMSSRRLSTLALLITLSSCVSPPSPPPPAEVALPKPAPVPPVVPASSDWRDWPLTPGDWSYAPGQRGSIARFLIEHWLADRLA